MSEVEADAGKLKYRNPLSDVPDQYLFFGLFFIGTLFIFTLKAYGVRQLFVTLAPVSLMVAYALIALFTKRYRLREDRVGDNIYYLGFLFTLVSLAYSLYVYTPDGAGAALIITNFGIAIFTTIFGLAGRVMFNQMREDPVEYEREARYSLADASRELRAQLFDIANQMNTFKRALVQMAQEGVTDVTASATASLKGNAQDFTDASKIMIEKVEAAFRAFTDQSTRLNELADKNAAGLAHLFDRIENIEASPELFSEKLDPIIAKFGEAADEALKRNRGQTAELKRMRELVDSAVEASKSLRVAIAGNDQAITDRLEAFGKQLGDIAKSAATVNQALGGAAHDVSAAIGAIKASCAALGQTLARQQEDLATIRTNAEADLNRVGEVKRQMEQMATKAREEVQSLQSALVSLSRTMVEHLGGRAGN